MKRRLEGAVADMAGVMGSPRERRKFAAADYFSSIGIP